MLDLLIFLTIIVSINANINEIYKSEAFKGLKIVSTRDLEPNFIPHRQCSGLVSGLECPPLAMEALQVSVTDSEPYPTVVIDDELATAEIYRKRNPVSGECEGAAGVQVSVACARHQWSARRRRRRAAPATATATATATRLPPAAVEHYL